MYLSKIYQNFVEPVFSFVLPAFCVLCQKPLVVGRKIVCKSCFDNLPALPNHLAESLKTEIPEKFFKELYLVYEFNKEFQILIHLLKYKRFLTIGKYFAEGLSQRINFVKFDIITGVPLNPIRERERGYNQSYLIARHVGHILNIPFDGALIERIKNTESQTKLNKEERINNVKDAFISRANLQDKHILLVDDVITTGSTLNACAKVLKQQGAAQVDVAALATPLNYLQNNLEKEVSTLESF